MRIRVKLFAAAKELAGAEVLEVDLPESASVADLRRAVVVAAPSLAKLTPHSLWAVDSNYVSSDTELNENSEVAMIPPVSGG